MGLVDAAERGTVAVALAHRREAREHLKRAEAVMKWLTAWCVARQPDSEQPCFRTNSSTG